MRNEQLRYHDQRALQIYLEMTIEHVVSALVDHDSYCPERVAVERLMGLAGWTEASVARAYVERMSL